MKVFSLMGIAALCAAAALPVHAQQLDINVNGDAFRIAMDGAMPNLGKASYDVGVISRSDDKNFLNVHGGLLLRGDAGAEEVRMRAGLGVRGQYIDIGDATGGGGALGGEFDVRLPEADRFSLFGYGYYQPKVLSTGDVDGQTEWALGLGYEVLRDASLYVGYREVRTDLGDYSYTSDDGAHIGLKLNF